MTKKVLIVEDQFVEANNLRMILERAGYQVCSIARSVPAALKIVEQEKPDLVLLDIQLQGHQTGIDLGKVLKEKNVAFVYLSANSDREMLEEAKATQPYGFLVKPFREKDVLITLDMVHYRYKNSLELRLQQEEILQKKLMTVSSETSSREKKMLNVIQAMQLHIPFDYVSVDFTRSVESDSPYIGYMRIGFEEYQTLGIDELVTMTGIKQAQLLALQTAESTSPAATRYNETAFREICRSNPKQTLLAKAFRLSSALIMPIPMGGKTAMTFSFYSRQSEAYSADHLATLNRLYPVLLTLTNGLAEEKQGITTEDASSLDSQFQGSKQPLSFNGIIGKSAGLQHVLNEVKLVASSASSVLILGESGTGKELIARALHNGSPRKDKLMVKVNCAALPPNLIESELFGHEKGAFTGATDRRIGKFELANGGTLFLDEIGEMPLELQVKLLRALQEKEIERVGGKTTLKVDVRIIAATNRDLRKEVAEGRFRLDLYYRLNVFPITLPPLRERKEDIPELARYFMATHARKAGRNVQKIADSAMHSLINYNWPGNVRELEHLLERSVLLATSSVINQIPLPLDDDQCGQSVDTLKVKTLDEHERDYILAILKKSNGKVFGPGGAAEQLNISSSTLYSKIERLGIKRKYVDA